MDSPTITTPVATDQRSYFPSHSRADSGASVDSFSSATTRYTSKPFAHSSQSSIATTSTAFSKKPSFASIRNAFKKSSEPPPVPVLEQQQQHPYPALKNPFNRSNSSLNVSPLSTRNPRPPTPSRGTTAKSKNHTPAKSQGSIFHASDGGSDLGHAFPVSPPPVPRVPNQFHRSDTPDLEDDKFIVDPKTPSDYALHAVFMRFATSAEGKIDTFLRLPIVCPITHSITYPDHFSGTGTISS